jgi:hypothetical protein
MRTVVSVSMHKILAKHVGLFEIEHHHHLFKKKLFQVKNQVSGRHNNEKNVIFKLKTKWVEDIIMKRMWYSSQKPSPLTWFSTWISHSFHYYVFHSLGFWLEYHILFIIMSSTHLVFNLNITFFCAPQHNILIFNQSVLAVIP